MIFIGLFFVLLLCVVWLSFIMGVRSEVENAVARILLIVGITGFFGFLFVPFGGDLLWWLELPPFYETTTMETLDGKRYAVIQHLKRIQRYGADGRYELGWFASLGKGKASLGFTKGGNIAVGSSYLRRVEIFSTDGRRLGPPIKLDDNFQFSLFGRAMEPAAKYREIGLFLSKVEQVDNPKSSWVTLLLLPLWHPFIAWYLMLAGMIVHGISNFSRNHKRMRRLD